MTDLQERLLKLLKITDELCRKYDVEYYLLGGTLIGAMRHNGFIPWDDDADVVMTRDNWEKFYNCTKGNLPEGYKISTQYEDENVAMPINRLTETDTTGLFRYHVSNPEVAGTQIDIFIMDPVPDTPEARKLYADTVSEFSEFTGMHVQYALRNGTDTHFIENWERAQEVGKRQVMDEISAKAFHFTEEESQLYGQRFGGSPHFWPKEVFGKPQYVPFENTMLAIPERPGDCLAIGYDDDWKMIPRGGPTLSTHDFVVRSYVTPSTEILADYEKHVDREKMDNTFLKRKFQWAAVIDDKLKNDTEVQKFEVARIKLIYKGLLEQTDIRALLVNKDFDKLDEFFEQYIESQSDSKLIGSSSLTGWIQYYRKHHPLLIDIGDDAIYTVLCLLIQRQKLALAVKIMRARCKLDRPLTDELSTLKKMIEAIRRVISTYGCNEDDECRSLVDEWIKGYPDNPFFVKHDLFLKIRHGLEGEGKLEEIERCLEIVLEDDELQLLLVEYYYSNDRMDEAIEICTKLVDTTNNGIVLTRVKSILEEVVEKYPDDSSYAKLLLNCRKQCGEPDAMMYIDDEDDDYDYEKEEDKVENSDSEDNSEEESITEDDIEQLRKKGIIEEMNDIQRCRLKLLNEMDEICRKNGIQYFLIGKILWQAIVFHHYTDPLGEITVAMTAENFEKFSQALSKQKLENRELESLENNSSYYRVVATYTDTETLDMPLIRYNTVKHPGIHINIEILRIRERTKLGEMRNRMFEKGWECHTIQRDKKFKTRLSMRFIEGYCSLYGDEKASKRIFARLLKEHSSKSEEKYYIRKFNRKRKYYPNELFETTSEILLEGKPYLTVSNKEEYMELQFRGDWKEREYPITKVNKYTRIIDAHIPYADYIQYLDEEDIDPIEFQQQWKALNMAYRPIKRKTKRIRKYWDILAACGERDRLYYLYHPQKEEIMKLYRAGNYEELCERMDEHIRVAEEFAKRKVGFSFDAELFEVMIDCLRYEDKEEEAEKLIKYNSKIEWEDIVKE